MDHNTRGFISDKNKMVGFIREARVKRRVAAHNAPNETTRLGVGMNKP